MPYPYSIELEGDVLEDFLTMSDFFVAMDRWEGHKSSYRLTAEKLFDNDQYAWQLFVDLFFPEKAPGIRKKANGTYQMFRVFHYLPNGSYGLNENVYIKEYVYSLFDFLMIDRSIWPRVMAYITNLHYHFQGRPERPPPAIRAPVLRSGYDANLALTPNVNENNVDENENNRKNVNLGFRNEEEEEAYGRVSKKNLYRFPRRGGRTRKLNKRSA